MKYMTENGDVTLAKVIDAIDAVTWYNGLAEAIVEWKNPGYFLEKHGNLSRGNAFSRYDAETRHQLEEIWMICVVLFGDYGTSPRYGWIENKEAFYQFCDDITETYRDWKARAGL